MTVYIDSSALVGRYAREVGSAWIQQIFSAADSVFIAHVTVVEVTSALARQATSRPQATRLVAQFEADLPDLNIVRLSDDVILQASDLAKRYRLRGYDAVPLASALWLNVSLAQVGRDHLDCLISADREINLAAPQEGLAVEDPNQHP